MLLKDRFLRFWQLNCDNFKYCQNGENTFETLDIFLLIFCLIITIFTNPINKHNNIVTYYYN